MAARKGRASAPEADAAPTGTEKVTAAEMRQRRKRSFIEVEARLVEANWHPTSKTWKQAIDRSWKATVMRVRGGRRGGKSSTNARIAVAEAIAGWPVPYGDIGVFSVLSADREQAADRVATCIAIAETLGIPHEPTKTEVRFPEHNTMIRVRAASTRGAVSSTAIGGIFDEFALWDDGNGANPAGAIIKAFVPSMATMPGACLRLISSAWTTSDALAEELRKERPNATTFTIPTWLGNPTLTEALCREMAESEEDFLLQYAAIPLEGAGTNPFPPGLIRPAMGLCPTCPKPYHGECQENEA